MVPFIFVIIFWLDVFYSPCGHASPAALEQLVLFGNGVAASTNFRDPLTLSPSALRDSKGVSVAFSLRQLRNGTAQESVSRQGPSAFPLPLAGLRIGALNVSTSFPAASVLVAPLIVHASGGERNPLFSAVRNGVVLFTAGALDSSELVLTIRGPSFYCRNAGGVIDISLTLSAFDRGDGAVNITNAPLSFRIAVGRDAAPSADARQIILVLSGGLVLVSVLKTAKSAASILFITRLSVLSRVVECSKELDFVLHPTRQSLGIGDGAPFFGALVFNMAVAGVAFLAHIALFHWGRPRQSFPVTGAPTPHREIGSNPTTGEVVSRLESSGYRVLAAGCRWLVIAVPPFPGHPSWLMLVAVFCGVTLAATEVLIASSVPLRWVLAGFYVVFLYAVWLWSVANAALGAAEPTSGRTKAAGGPAAPGGERVLAFEGNRWTHRTNPTFVARWWHLYVGYVPFVRIPLVSGLPPPHVSFDLLASAVLCVVAATTSAMPESQTTCRPQAIGVLCVVSIELAFLIWLRTVGDTAELLASTMFRLVDVAVAVCALVATFLDGPANAAVTTGNVVAMLGALFAAARCIGHVIRLCRNREPEAAVDDFYTHEEATASKPVALVGAGRSSPFPETTRAPPPPSPPAEGHTKSMEHVVRSVVAGLESLAAKKTPEPEMRDPTAPHSEGELQRGSSRRSSFARSLPVQTQNTAVPATPTVVDVSSATTHAVVSATAKETFTDIATKCEAPNAELSALLDAESADASVRPALGTPLGPSPPRHDIGAASATATKRLFAGDAVGLTQEQTCHVSPVARVDTNSSVSILLPERTQQERDADNDRLIEAFLSGDFSAPLAMPSPKKRRALPRLQRSSSNGGHGTERELVSLAFGPRKNVGRESFRGGGANGGHAAAARDSPTRGLEPDPVMRWPGQGTPTDVVRQPLRLRPSQHQHPRDAVLVLPEEDDAKWRTVEDDLVDYEAAGEGVTCAEYLLL